MNPIRLSLALALLCTSLATAQDKTSALYVHPVGIAVLAAAGVPTVYLTYEREVAAARSLTLQPFVGGGSFKNSGDAVSTDVTQFGSILSYRFYFNGAEPKGWYAAPATGLCYMSLEQESHSAGWFTVPRRSGSATQFVALGYIGHRSRNEGFTWFWDFGLGAQAISTSGDVKAEQSTGPMIDMNLGLGFRL